MRIHYRSFGECASPICIDSACHLPSCSFSKFCSISGRQSRVNNRRKTMIVSAKKHSTPSNHYPWKGAGSEIGAEYGEGFLQFRLSGEKTRLDVDTLNERLRVRGADRIRHSMRPDEAFGLIFDLDNVLIDTRAIQQRAWMTVAQQENFHFPSIERPHMYDLRPERAIIEVLQWTHDMKRAQEVAWKVATCYSGLLAETTNPLPGVDNWLALMSRNNIPCALITHMNHMMTKTLLESIGLDQKFRFDALVTAEDDMDTAAQQYLSAAMKLNRPPDQCVVFGATPSSIAAAHNCTMRSIAVLGPHTGPELRAADLTIGSMTELTVYNLRRLFANKGSDFMDLKKARIGQGPTKRRLRHATE